MNLICRAVNFWLKWQSDLLLAKTGKSMTAMEMTLPKPEVECKWNYHHPQPELKALEMAMTKPKIRCDWSYKSKPGKPDKPPGKPPSH